MVIIMNYLEFLSTRANNKELQKTTSKVRLENILYYLALKERTRLDAPTIVGLDITSRCNLRCKHCFQNERSLPKELEGKEWIRVIHELKEMKVYQIYIMGGEPFIRQDILPILREIKECGMTLSINTNATLISEAIADELRKILEPRFDYIQVSMDGATREVNDSIRGNGQFSLILEKIKLLKSKGIKIRVNSVINTSNVMQMSEIYELCSKLEVDRIAFTTIYPYKRESLLDVPDNDKCIKEFDRMLKTAERLGNGVLIEQDPICIPHTVGNFQSYFENHLSQSPLLVCRAGLFSCEIDPQGDVYPCTFMHYPQYKAGNIASQSFFDIWRNSENWRTIIDKGDALNTTCKKCVFSEKCKGGCIAAGLDTGHGIGGGDPRCRIIYDEYFGDAQETC
mgnify:CR=1 FL=1